MGYIYIFTFLGIYIVVESLGHMKSSGAVRSHQQGLRTMISPHLLQHLVLSVFIITLLMGMKWCLTGAVMGISLMANDFEHLSVCLLAICASSLENCVLTSFAHFAIRLSFYY